MISNYSLYKAIKQHQKLAAKRHPMFEKNRFAKFLSYFMVLYFEALFLLYGIGLPLIFEEEFPGMEPYHMLDKGIIFLFAADFLIRFMFQKTPDQEIKPYLLLPVKRTKLIKIFLLQSVLSGYNLWCWFGFIVPFAFITLFKFYGFVGVFGYLLGFWLLMVFNNFWYLICRTLINEKWYTMLLPLVVYAVLILPEFIFDIDFLSTFSMNFIEGFILWDIRSYVLIVLAILVLVKINVSMQIHFMLNEILKVEDTKVKNVSEYKFLNRFGEVGEYMRLELKLLTRNKVPRQQFIMGLLLMFSFSALLAFTEVYDTSFMKQFICIYNFAVLGVMTLGSMMAYEGNYMDGLMSRKESLFTLLRAKYYINCLILVVPFAIMITPIAEGKITFLMAISYLCFTAGFIFALMFQLAVYNNRTVQLNTSVLGKNQGGNFFQSMIVAVAFFVPILINNLLITLFNEDIALVIMLVIGVSLMATHTLWLKNIYRRFMKRRYQRMQEFRDSK